MCKKLKGCGRQVDSCMRLLIGHLRLNEIKTLGSCCGHGRYPMTIVVKYGSRIMEICSGKYLHRKKKFYKRDKDGYYYIPETLN